MEQIKNYILEKLKISNNNENNVYDLCGNLIEISNKLGPADRHVDLKQLGHYYKGSLPEIKFPQIKGKFKCFILGIAISSKNEKDIVLTYSIPTKRTAQIAVMSQEKLAELMKQSDFETLCFEIYNLAQEL